MAIADFVRRVAGDRIKGRRPSPMPALAVSAIAGAAAAGLAYKALRK